MVWNMNIWVIIFPSLTFIATVGKHIFLLWLRGRELTLPCSWCRCIHRHSTPSQHQYEYILYDCNKMDGSMACVQSCDNSRLHLSVHHLVATSLNYSNAFPHSLD